MFAFFVVFEYFDQGCVSPFFSCALCVNVIGLLFLAAVFYKASQLWVFNEPSAASTCGDISMWDVAKVTDMSQSKSIRMLENDLA